MPHRSANHAGEGPPAGLNRGSASTPVVLIDLHAIFLKERADVLLESLVEVDLLGLAAELLVDEAAKRVLLELADRNRRPLREDGDGGGKENEQRQSD